MSLALRAMIKQLPIDKLYNYCLNIFNEMSITNIDQGNAPNSQSIRLISGVAPSVWGWGGMQLSVKVYQTDDNSSIELNGFIAQLGVSPLTEKMDEFLKRLQNKLLIEDNYNFQYKKLTGFLPKYKLHFSKTDGLVLLLIVMVTFITTFANVFGNVSEAIMLGPTLGIAYYLGKKYLFGNKSPQRR